VKEDEENKLSWVFYDLNEKDFLAGIFVAQHFLIICFLSRLRAPEFFW
jgi:hypothetical protein